jgi:uncharacterized membrane protein
LIIAFLLLALLGLIGIVVKVLWEGLMLIANVVSLEVGVAILIIASVIINVVGKKISVSRGSKFSFVREIILIKNLSEDLLRNGRLKVVWIRLPNNISAIGFTNGVVGEKGKMFVFIPSTPLPVTGITFAVDPENIEYSALTVMEALTILAVGGLGGYRKEVDMLNSI